MTKKIKSNKNNILYQFLLTIAEEKRPAMKKKIMKALDVSDSYVRTLYLGLRKLRPWMAQPLQTVTNGFIKAEDIPADRKRRIKHTKKSKSL